MICHDARHLFTPLADDGLAPGERASVQAHLADCPDCRRDWQRFQRTLTALHDLPTLRAPIGFVDQVVSRARAEHGGASRRTRRLLRRLFVPLTIKVPLEAAAVVLISVAVVYVARQTPELQRPMPATMPPQQEAAPRLASPLNDTASVAKPQIPAIKGEAREAAARAREALQSPAASAEPKVAGRLESADRRAVRDQFAIAPPAPTASVMLTTPDIDGAGRLLTEALKRAGGVEIGRRTEGDSLVVEAEVPRAGWAGLGEALRQAGRVVLDPEPAGTGDPLRIVVRIGP